MRRLTSMFVLLPLLMFGACSRDAGLEASLPSEPALPATPPPPNDTPAGQRIEADVRVLADDAMEGRETGTPGYDRAAEYVAKRFAEIGLQPAGDGGTWFQRVSLVASTRVADGARLAIHRDGKTIELRYGDQFLPGTSAREPEVEITAPAVFVVHGIHAPDLGHDDFAGLDLAGKIVVAFPDAPDAFAGDLRAYHSSRAARLEALASRGAVGMVMLATPASAARMPWQYIQSTAGKPGMSLVGADGGIVDAPPGLRAGAMVNVTAADLLFEGTGKVAAELFDAATRGEARGFDLPGTLTLSTRSKIERVETRNVVAKLPGSDPALADEHVVYTAHLDHMGIGEAVDGDAIHNGALDNALGVAIVLEAARELKSADVAPKRSTLFVAVGAEEQGLLGSRRFALTPTVSGPLVANINIDMPMLTAPTTDIVPIGIEHSTLKAALEQVAGEIGVTLSPDPFPEEVVFVRSDQFSFVLEGIPAVYLDGGVVGANEQQDPKRAVTWFLRNCYHKPCDQIDLPIHYGDAARMARVAARLGQVVGDATERPRWNDGNFFGRTFGKRASE